MAVKMCPGMNMNMPAKTTTTHRHRCDTYPRHHRHNIHNRNSLDNHLSHQRYSNENNNLKYSFSTSERASVEAFSHRRHEGVNRREAIATVAGTVVGSLARTDSAEASQDQRSAEPALTLGATRAPLVFQLDTRPEGELPPVASTSSPDRDVDGNANTWTMRVAVYFPRSSSENGAGFYEDEESARNAARSLLRRHADGGIVVFTAGFLLPSQRYIKIAQTLAAAGFVTVLYDNTSESIGNVLTDRQSVAMLVELTEFLTEAAGSEAGLILAGHSRGGKLSSLAAQQLQMHTIASSARRSLAGLVLLDPVDSNIYQPVSTEFPSANEELAAMRTRALAPAELVPMLVVAARADDPPGAGRNANATCVPPGSGYPGFIDAYLEYRRHGSSADIAGGNNAGDGGEGRWRRLTCCLVEIDGATHFQFLSEASIVDDAICPAGPVESEGVIGVSTGAIRVFAAEALSEHRALKEGTNTAPGAGADTRVRRFEENMMLGIANATFASMHRIHTENLRMAALKPATATLHIYNDDVA